MEPERSLPHSQVPVTCPNLEPARPSPYPPNLTSWRSILILSSHLHLGFPSVLFPTGFPTKTLFTTLLSSMCATCPTQLIFFDFITRTILGEQYGSLSSSLCRFLHSPVTSSLLGPHILLNTLFSNTLSLRSSLNVSDQVSYPYKTTGKIIILYILIFIFWDSKLEDKDSAPNDSKHSRTSWTHLNQNKIYLADILIKCMLLTKLITRTVASIGRSRVRFPMVSLEFFIDIILPAALWPWGWLSL